MSDIAAPEKPERLPANSNRWYCLMTLHGEQPEWLNSSNYDDKLHAKNRHDWNRWAARALNEEQRQALLAAKDDEGNPRFSEAELTPHSAAEWKQLAAAFRTRANDGGITDLSEPHMMFNLIEIDFSRGVVAKGMLFPNTVYFSGSTFPRGADLSGATFSRYADLSGASFSGDADLSGAVFSNNANFSDATFSLDANFSGANFSRKHWTTFEHATFGGIVNFLNAELDGDTSFARAIFKTHPPSFHGAKLNEGAAFDGVQWPAPPVPVKRATNGDAANDRIAKWDWERARNALEGDIKNYQRLKQMMETLKKHEDELEFFAREMALKRVLHKTNGENAKAWLLKLYEMLSGYGRSILRPLLVIAAASVPFGILYDVLPLLNGSDLSPREALGLSLANSFGIFSFAKDAAGIDPKQLSAATRTLGVVQAGLGAFMLFLAGLGLRNRFRMK